MFLFNLLLGNPDNNLALLLCTNCLYNALYIGNGQFVHVPLVMHIQSCSSSIGIMSLSSMYVGNW